MEAVESFDFNEALLNGPVEEDGVNKPEMLDDVDDVIATEEECGNDGRVPLVAGE